MGADPAFDRWYAAKSAKFLVSPSHGLETFGSTLVNWSLVSELPDSPGKVRIREGRLEAHRPLVITPDFSGIETEGFGPEAREYVEFLKDHGISMRILKYGCHLKTDSFSEQVVSDSVEAVAERVKAAASGDPSAAVILGVDEPWDVALVELWRREVEKSAGRNLMELDRKGRLFGGPAGEDD